MKPIGGASDFEAAVESQISHDKKADKEAENVKNADKEADNDKKADKEVDISAGSEESGKTECATNNTECATNNTECATNNTGGSVEKIELSPSVGTALGISIKGGLDHPFLVNKEDKVRGTRTR